MTLHLDIEECAKTVGETIANDTFFGVYEDIDTMIRIIKAAKLDAKQGIYIFDGIKSQKFSFDDMVQIFKSINIHFDSSNEEGIDDFFDFIQSAYKALKFRPLKEIYNFINDICNDNTDLLANYTKLKEENKILKEEQTNSNQKLNEMFVTNTNTIKSLESEVNRLNKENDSLISENKKLQNANTQLNSNIVSLQKDIADLKVENSRLSSQIRSNDAKISSINEAIKEADFNKVYTMFNDFLSKGNKELIKIFCKLGLSEVKDNDEQTLLSYASTKGNLDLIRSLIEGGCDRDAVNKYGNNALVVASVFGKTDVVRYFISAGFDKEWKNKSDGSNAIICASQNGYLDTVKYLVSIGCDVNSKQNNNANSSYFAAWKGHLEVLKFLQSSGCDIKWKDNIGDTSLHGAARGNCVAIIEYLLSQGLDINERGWNGFTPLHQAVDEGGVESVEYLIKCGAKLNEKDKQNRTPLDIAKSKNLAKIRDILINAGAI